MLWEKFLNFFKFVSVLCFETSFRIQELMREIFWFLKTWKFLKKNQDVWKEWNIWEKIYELFEKTLLTGKLLSLICT